MPWITRKQRQAELEELEKARGLTPAYGASDATQLVNMIARAQGGGRDAEIDHRGNIMFRPDEWVTAEFGPNHPLNIEPLDNIRDDSGFPEPRQYQYPVAENLRYFNTRPVAWSILKQTADSPLFRACIEIKKAELTTLDWRIQIAQDAVEEIAKDNRQSKQEVESILRQKIGRASCRER